MSLSVDDYFKELETTLTKVDMSESEESKMARFVSGLRRKIKDVVELYGYSSLEKLVHLTIKVESQLSKKTFSNLTKIYLIKHVSINSFSTILVNIRLLMMFFIFYLLNHASKRLLK